MLFTSVLVTIFMTILKAYAWLLKQMFKLIWNVYKLFLCLFPAAGIVLAALVVFESAGYFTGNDYIGQAKEYVEKSVHASDIEYLQGESFIAKADSSYGISDVNEHSAKATDNKKADDLSESSDYSLEKSLTNNTSNGLSDDITNNIVDGMQQSIESGVNDISEKVTQTLLETVTSWWEGILEKSEQKAYSIIAWVITILIGIPIFLGLLLLSAAASGVNFLGIAIIADLAIYIFRSIFGMTTPFRQFRRRYCFLFHTKPFYDPKYEDSYQDWLKRHHDEFENDTFGTDRAVNDEYEEDYDRMGQASYEGRRLSRKDIRKLEKIKKRQKNYDDYYEDYYDRLEEQEEEEGEEFQNRRWNKSYYRRNNRNHYDDRYNKYDPDEDDNDDYDRNEYDHDEDDYYDTTGGSYKRIDDEDHYDRMKNDKYEEYEYRKGYRGAYSDKKNQYSSNRRTNSSRSSESQKSAGNYSSFDFFAGCKSRDGVVKKYHSLAKLYHPDNFEGDSSAITEINRQYKEAIGKYK